MQATPHHICRLNHALSSCLKFTCLSHRHYVAFRGSLGTTYPQPGSSLFQFLGPRPELAQAHPRPGRDHGGRGIMEAGSPHDGLMTTLAVDFRLATLKVCWQKRLVWGDNFPGGLAGA